MIFETFCGKIYASYHYNDYNYIFTVCGLYIDRRQLFFLYLFCQFERTRLMNETKPEVQLPKEKRKFGSKLKLLLYDTVICLFVEILFLIVYNPEKQLTAKDIVFHMIFATLSLVGMRFAWRIYGQIWRYGGIQSYIRLIASDACACVLYGVLQRALPFFAPITILRAFSITSLSLLLSLTIRMVYRYAYKCCTKDSTIGRILSPLIRIFAGGSIKLGEGKGDNRIRVAIVGAGRVGVALAEDLQQPSSSYQPKCFIDNNEEKIGRQIYNLPIFSDKDVTEDLLTKYEVQEIIFALPRMGHEEKKALYDHYKAFGRKVKIYDYPVMEQVGANGKRHLRDFDVEELLFRKPVKVIDEKTSAFYKDKIILITGGGGSIGSELCRQVAGMQPKSLIILDVYENGAYDVQQELRQAYGDKLDLHVEILSVCNRPALERVFATYHPDVVLHAAAHKHVPLMEHNCCEAVENNVFGTLNTVELSEKYNVGRFMMVSTDKAVNPTNVMGATKRMCEMIVQSHSKSSTTTTFSATRFGNVLGSAGSVIPLFRRQIAAGGPVTVTDKRIIRYFMTIPEASQLVLQSASMAKNGELFVLDMGKPVKILELAESMIRLSGFRPYEDIKIIETGLRPGEKLYEELLVKTETLGKTENSLIFIERDEPLEPEKLGRKLDYLREAVKEGSDEKTKEILHAVVPTFLTPEEVNCSAQKSDEMQSVESVENAENAENK